MTSPARIRLIVFILVIGVWSAGASPGARPLSAPFAVDLRADADMNPSWSASTGPLAAYGYRVGAGLGFRSEGWIPVRGRADFFFTGNSAWDASLFRFRSFWGFRFAAMSGYALPLGERFRIEGLAGGAVSMSRYTGISAVTAYPSIIGELGASYRLGPSKSSAFGIFAALPLEYMFRGTARTFSAGFGAGIHFPLRRR